MSGESLNVAPTNQPELIDGMPAELAPEIAPMREAQPRPVIDHVPGMPAREATPEPQPVPAHPTEHTIGLPAGMVRGPQLGSFREAPPAGPGIIDKLPDFQTKSDEQ